MIVRLNARRPPGAARPMLRSGWTGLIGIGATLACLELIEALAATPLRIGAPGSLLQLVAVVVASVWGTRWGLASALVAVVYQYLHAADPQAWARFQTAVWTIPASALLAGELRRRAVLAAARAEAARRETAERERLERLQREFLGLAAHELKNPLAALRASVQLLERRREYNPRLVGLAMDQTRRLERLVEDLLDVARLEEGRFRLVPEPTDLVGLVEEAVRACEGQTTCHRFVVQAPEQLVGRWDRDRLAQVLANLLGNAITYTPGGTVSVRLATARDRALLSVSDEGPGIAAEDRARLFERFYRPAAGQRATQQGMGLGLYISRGIARAHGGELRVSSAPGRGATFTLELPTAAHPPSGEGRAGEGETSAGLGV